MSNQYFGYGERTPEVMGAIIGRVPDYDAAVLAGFRLFTQNTVDMSEPVRNIMAINRSPEEMESSQFYVAVASEGDHIPGLVYRGITDQEFALVGNFDLEGLWLKLYRGRFIHIFNEDGSSTRLGDADYHANPSGILTKPAPKFEGIFPPSLSNPERTLEIATIARMKFLAEN